MRNNEETSILLRCLHMLEPLLECRFPVEHVAWLSDKAAELADHWSREETITEKDKQTAAGIKWRVLTGTLAN